MLTLSEVTAIDGEAGDFTVTVKQAPRYVDMEKCIACGTCAEKCPKKIANEYNEGIDIRKAIFVPYPQAVPLKYSIDAANCIYFKNGKCKACEKFCPTEAIRFDDTEKERVLNVGAIIMATGFKPFSPSGLDNYQYANYTNVVTSIEFERLLSAGGPTKGAVRRLSDGKAPTKIAWLQCVGSRDLNRCDNEYCSSVCCMYALKEAMMAREHVHGDFEASIFFMDMRTYGKDFEKYYERARAEGVRFIRSRVHTITEKPDGTLRLRYVDESGKIVEEEFDLVVLSVGMEASKATAQLAADIGVELNASGFVKTDPFLPTATTRPGIFVAGVARGCKDIPESVVEASAAAENAARILVPARGSLARRKEFPRETDVTGKDPKIGVFVCNCGSNIGGLADVPEIVEYAKTLPGVVYAQENLFTCSQDTQDAMTQTIRDHGLNRVVVAACTPRTHEPLFQETLRNAGLNPFLFEMANIRNQCTWVHSSDKQTATQKAKDLLAMSVARANRLESLSAATVEIDKHVLVVGGGIAGITAALSLADQGFPAIIVEKDERLGGAAVDNGNQDVREYLNRLIETVSQHAGIEVLTSTQVIGGSGFIGNFDTDLASGGDKRTVRHGAVIIATGGAATDTDEYLYGKNDRVTRWHDIRNHPALSNAGSVVFIQCVGSRDENRPYCSKICCTASVENAIFLKEQNPDTQVYILYRDIRTYGEKERLYKKARELGVIFIRYTTDRKPLVEETGDSLKVTVFDPILGANLEISADLVNLATAIKPGEHSDIARIFKVSTNAENFLAEAHAKLRPVDCATDGVFICGLAHYPKFMEESIAQAQAAAARAVTVLSREQMEIMPIVSEVNQDLCIGCGLCEISCAFGAIRLKKVEGLGYRAENISALCKGCGICAAACPQKAIDMKHFRDLQITAAVAAGN